MPAFAVPFGNTAVIRVKDAIGNYWTWDIPMLHTIEICFEPIQLSHEARLAIEDVEKTMAMNGVLKRRPLVLQRKYVDVWRQRCVQIKTMKRNARIQSNVLDHWKHVVSCIQTVRCRFAAKWMDAHKRAKRMQRSCNVLRSRIVIERLKVYCQQRKRQRYFEFIALRWKWSYYGGDLISHSIQFRVSHHILCNIRALYDRLSHGHERGFCRDALDTIYARKPVMNEQHLRSIKDKILIDSDRYCIVKNNLTPLDVQIGIILPCIAISPLLMMHSTIQWFHVFFSKYSSEQSADMWLNRLILRTDVIPGRALGLLLHALQIQATHVLLPRLPDFHYPYLKYDEFLSQPRCYSRSRKYHPGPWMQKFLQSVIDYDKPFEVRSHSHSKIKTALRSKAEQRKSKK